MTHGLAELRELESLLESLDQRAHVRVLCRVPCRAHRFPVHAITLGCQADRTSPVFVMVGGVHGLERIGTQVILAHLRSLDAYLKWDTQLPALLERMRLVFIPMLNPAGVYLRRRSNGRGVDLMRNAPTDAREPAPAWHLFRGQRLTPILPWYRGQDGGGMEREAHALCDFVEQEVFPAQRAICLDVHSGFAGRDRVWFPYAGSRELFPGVAEAYMIKQLFDEAFPYHNYKIEPQALHYTAHGDLWDYLYDRKRASGSDGLFLPLTLELASSSWFRKNPRQLFERHGLFHPIKPHRVRRVLRRHWALLQFLTRLTLSGDVWDRPDRAGRAHLEAEAFKLWGPMGALPVGRADPQSGARPASGALPSDRPTGLAGIIRL